MIFPEIHSDRFILRCLDPLKDYFNYLTWLTNPKDYPFIESAKTNYSSEELVSYLTVINNSMNAIQFGIFTKDSGIHIGNIKFHEINASKFSAFVGFLIGDKNWQGRGVALEVFGSASKFLRDELGVDTFYLGVSKKNFPALKSYLKMGFKESQNKIGLVNSDSIFMELKI